MKLHENQSTREGGGRGGGGSKRKEGDESGRANPHSTNTTASVGDTSSRVDLEAICKAHQL